MTSSGRPQLALLRVVDRHAHHLDDALVLNRKMQANEPLVVIEPGRNCVDAPNSNLRGKRTLDL